MANELLFSPVNLWEIEIKRDSLGVDARTMQQSLTGHGYTELPLTARHVIGLSQLPVLHKDPFDRMLLSQAAVEKVFLLTADSQIGRYSQFVDGIITFG
jgi:PIN domain nuclease of toxin-antitoxin system